uniref:Secreted protein n=1 Tax=Anguilla anguilla TaxID=7936 RepID=A0A0E9P7W2_ANGAN
MLPFCQLLFLMNAGFWLRGVPGLTLKHAFFYPGFLKNYFESGPGHVFSLYYEGRQRDERNILPHTSQS